MAVLESDTAAIDEGDFLAAQSVQDARVAEAADAPLLTPRQTEVVRLAMLGLTAKESARRLGVSKNTVDEHLREARRRVGAPTKTRLIAWAVARGIVPYQAHPQPQPRPATAPAESRRVRAR
jgi:DNA-binding CsgD family transcriptional regulator